MCETRGTKKRKGKWGRKVYLCVCRARLRGERGEKRSLHGVKEAHSASALVVALDAAVGARVLVREQTLALLVRAIL